ncbi:MAG: BatD family protein [Candidatus Babeliales bacterium]|jgi:hypothetical protein
MVSKIIRNALIPLTLFFSCTAQETTVKLELENVGMLPGSQQPAVAPGQQFTLVVSTEGKDRTTNDPVIEGLEKFQLQGQRSTSRIQVVNGSVTGNIQRFLTVKTDNPGRYTIGPAVITQGDKKITSNSVSIMVDAKVVPSQQASSDHGHEDAQTASVICKLAADKQVAVIGEPITVNLMIYTHGPILDMAIDQPHFEKFLVKQIKTPVVKDIMLVGKSYKLQQYTFVLFPQHIGTNTIKPLNLVYITQRPQQAPHHQRGFLDEVFSRSFFGAQPVQKQIQSNGLTIVVKQVPSSDGPVDGVGSFSQFNAELSKHEAVVGEPVTLSLSLKGLGNFEQISLPKPQLSDGFRCYESKTALDENLETAYQGGTKKTEFVIQAMKPGAWTIPAQTFTFYDTQQQTFKKISTSPLSLTIKQGDQPTTSAPSMPRTQNDQTGRTIEPFSQDISFIQENFMDSSQEALPWWLFFVLMVTPLVFVCRVKLQLLRTAFRRLEGGRGAHQKFAHFKRELDRLTTHKEVSALHHFVMRVLAQYVKRPVEQLTESDIEALLAHKGWQVEKISELLDYLNTCAQFRFATTKTTSSLECDELFKKAHYWLVILNH